MVIGAALAASPVGLLAHEVSLLEGVNPTYALVYVFAMAFPAMSSIVKEGHFHRAQQQLGRPLDIFVVNSFASLFQATSVLLLMPLVASIKGVPPAELPLHLLNGKCSAAAHTFPTPPGDRPASLLQGPAASWA